MIRIVLLLGLVALVMSIYSVLDILTTPRAQLRYPKLVWVVLVVALPLVGAATWLWAGRARRASVGGGQADARGRDRRGWSKASPSVPVAPDDDEEFLRALRWRLERERRQEERERGRADQGRADQGGADQGGAAGGRSEDGPGEGRSDEEEPGAAQAG